MKGNTKVIDTLNDYLSIELTHHNQNLAHARMAARSGHPRLAKHRTASLQDEPKHLTEGTQAVRYPEGEPNVPRPRTVQTGRTVTAQLHADQVLLTDVSLRLNKAVGLAGKAGDNGSRGLLENSLPAEEHLLHGRATRLTLQVGEQDYLPKHVCGPDRSASGARDGRAKGR